MDFEIIINNRKLNVELIQKKSIKYCYLSIKSAQQLQIRAHRFFTIEDAKALIDKKSIWLTKNLKKQEAREIVQAKSYFLGEIINDNNIVNIDEFYKTKAKEYLPLWVQEEANRMQLFPTKLSFRKNKTRMGSCSVKNAISLNTLLMRYPKEVIKYVIIHEMAHIKHKNHSQAFWNLVETYCADYKVLDAQLKMF